MFKVKVPAKENDLLKNVIKHSLEELVRKGGGYEDAEDTINNVKMVYC